MRNAQNTRSYFSGECEVGNVGRAEMTSMMTAVVCPSAEFAHLGAFGVGFRPTRSPGKSVCSDSVCALSRSSKPKSLTKLRNRARSASNVRRFRVDRRRDTHPTSVSSYYHIIIYHPFSSHLLPTGANDKGEPQSFKLVRPFARLVVRPNFQPQHVHEP